MIKEIKKKELKESPLQQKAFLTYFDLGEKRSMERAVQELNKAGIKISKTSIANWSKKFDWIERIKKLDEEVYKRLEDISIKQAITSKKEFLTTIRNTIIQYSKNLKNGLVDISPSDFKKMWEMHRAEIGEELNKQPTFIVNPISAVQVEVNQRVDTTEKLIKKVEDEMEKEIIEEIKQIND